MSDEFKPKGFVQRGFTNALKKEVKEAGLIDTGTLYNSIDVNVSIDEFGVMTVDVFAADYIKYLWFPYRLDSFVNRGVFLWSAMRQWTAWKIEQNPLLDWNITNPKIVFNLPE